MTPRHRAYRYLRACAALLLGYHHIHVLDDLRMKRKRLLRRPSEDWNDWAPQVIEKGIAAFHSLPEGLRLSMDPFGL